MSMILLVILLIITFILYFLCCSDIYRRKNFTSISIRSPVLLLLNIIGNFFMCVIITLTQLLENDQRKICSFFYYITNFLIIIPFCLRFRRIAVSCEIKIDQKLELQELTANKFSYEEKHSLKIMLVIFIIFAGILIIANVLTTGKEAITAKFLYSLYQGSTDRILESANSFIWLGVNFIEHIIILSYVYKICINQLKQKLRFEIISCFIIWFLYSNLMAIFEMLPVQINNDVYVYISLAVCYLYFILNGILPLAVSYSYNYSTSYSFNPKLMNNLYLFLSNESCYQQFKLYLIHNNQNLVNALKLYIGIMNFKLGKKLNLDNEQILRDINEIKLEFFEANNIANLPRNIFDGIKNEWNKFDRMNINHEIFDEALKYCYTELRKVFTEFKNSVEFKDLYNRFYLTTYIQCKLCNIGLIKNFN